MSSQCGLTADFPIHPDKGPEDVAAVLAAHCKALHINGDLGSSKVATIWHDGPDKQYWLRIELVDYFSIGGFDESLRAVEQVICLLIDPACEFVKVTSETDTDAEEWWVGPRGCVLAKHISLVDDKIIKLQAEKEQLIDQLGECAGKEARVLVSSRDWRTIEGLE